MSRPPATIAPDDVDFDRPGTLVRLALVARVDALRDEIGERVSRVEVAKALRLSPAALSKSLRADALEADGADDFVQRLQTFLQVRESRLGEAGSEIAAFRKQILRRSGIQVIGLRVPTTFFEPLARSPRDSLEELLVVGATLVGIRAQADTLQVARGLRQITPDLIDSVAEEMVVACYVPDRRFRVTMTLTAQLRDWVIPIVSRHLERSPIASRAARVLARMQRALPAAGRTDGEDLLWSQIAAALRGPRMPDIDPGRGYYEEALRFSPGWSAPAGRRRFEQEWIPETLAATAADPIHPTRQRAFAALCLAERSGPERERASQIIAGFRGGDAGEIHAYECLREVIDRHDDLSARVASGRRPEQTALRARGLEPFWAASTAARHLGELVLDPSTGRAAGQRRSRLESLPATVRGALVRVVVWALVSPDITQRRMACDTLAAANAAGHACGLIGQVVGSAGCPIFLREIGATVLGYLGDAEAVGPLCDLVDDTGQEPGTRRAAVLALGEVGDALTDQPRRRARASLIGALAEPPLQDAALFASASRERQDHPRPEPDRRSREALEEAIGQLAAAGGPLASIAGWAQAQVAQPGGMPVNPLALAEAAR